MTVSPKHKQLVCYVVNDWVQLWGGWSALGAPYVRSTTAGETETQLGPSLSAWAYSSLTRLAPVHTQEWPLRASAAPRSAPLCAAQRRCRSAPRQISCPRRPHRCITGWHWKGTKPLDDISLSCPSSPAALVLPSLVLRARAPSPQACRALDPTQRMSSARPAPMMLHEGPAQCPPSHTPCSSFR